MDIALIKSYFPALVNDPSLIYADNAATTQRPQEVINTLLDFERTGVANIHRGLYNLAEVATQKYESARTKISQFINAPTSNCIAFTKGTTEAINIVAFGFLKGHLKAGDEVVVSAMEHHANFIPWQQICKESSAALKVIPVDCNGDLILTELQKVLTSRTKLVAITHISNTLGTINPIEEIIKIAHKKEVPVLIDAAQSLTHDKIDVQKWGADFVVFSAHKMFGPFGVGVLYANSKYRAQIKPINFGGGAIKNVSIDETELLSYPRNIEAGTPNISGVIGFSSALDFLMSLKCEEVSNHQYTLGKQLREGIEKLQGFSVVGNARQKSGIVSFIHENIHPHDIASFLASRNIAVRAGHHCTQPLLDFLGVGVTVRASFSIYNSASDVEKMIEALKDLKKFW